MEADANLVVVRGGDVQINFLRWDHYQNGVQVARGSVLGFTVENKNGNPEPAKFELQFKTFNGDSDISSNSNDIALDHLQVRAQNEQNLGGANDTYFGWLVPQTTFQTLFEHDFGGSFSSTDWTTHQVHIDYFAGDPGVNDLIGEQPGFYSIQLQFRLEVTF